MALTEEARRKKIEYNKQRNKETNYAAQQKYVKEKTKRYTLSVTINTEKDIIDKLESVENKNGYIKSLIKADINKG